MMKTKYLVLVFCATGLAATLARADLDITISGDIILGRRPPPPVVVVVVHDTPPGPPSWAARRWYQRNQEYYYYPGYDVYYRPADRVWFYQDRGQWRNGRNLPPGFRVAFDRSITLTMATDRPYQFHQQVVTRYPANYFGTKVRLRNDNRHDQDHDNRGRDKDDHKSDRDRDEGDHGKPDDRGKK